MIFYHLQNFSQHHSLRKSRYHSQGNFYISQGLYEIGIGLISLFLPIYLYNLGFSLGDILLFWFACDILYFVFTHLARHLIIKFGVIKAMTLANVVAILTAVYVLFFISNLTEISWFLLLPIAFLRPFYFSISLLTSCYYYSGKVKDNAHLGQQSSIIRAVKEAGSILTPLLSGLIIYLVSFEFSLIVGGIILLISVVPLLKSPLPKQMTSMKEKHVANLKSYRRIFKTVSFKKMILETSFLVGSIYVWWYWSVYIAITIFKDNPFLILGAILSGGGFLAILISLWTGKMLDKNHPKIFVLAANGVKLVLNFLKLFIVWPGAIIAHDISFKQAGNCLGCCQKQIPIRKPRPPPGQ